MNRTISSIILSRRVRVVLVLCAALLAGCGGGDAESIPEPTAPATATRVTATPAPAYTSTPEPTVTPSITPFRIPTFPPTITPFVFPTSAAQPTTALMGLIQTCLNRTRTGAAGLYILQVQPTPPLVWDTSPHMFNVILCNANPPSSTTSGQFKIFISFPGSDRGHAESDSVTAQLTSGYNEVSVGPWVPGLENHISACAMRPMTQIEVHWNGAPLLWLDGKGSVNIPIGCGGNFS